MNLDAPVPSQEVADLQQSLFKSEENRQNSYRAARTAELSAEAAEERLDSKYGIKESFDAEKKRADELEMRLAEVSREKDVLKAEMAQVKQEFQERIDHLTCRLAQYEGGLQEPVQQLPPAQVKQEEEEVEKEQPPQLLAQQLLLQQFPDEAAAVAPMIAKALELHSVPHPTNIFQLCRYDKGQALTLGEVYGRLKSALMKGGKARFFKSCPNATLHCDLCEKTFTKFAIFDHFFSDHYHKAKAMGAAVSRAALFYWVGKMQPASAAGVAAAPRWGGARKAVKKEVKREVKKEEVDE